MSCPIANPGPQLSPAVSRRRLSGSELLLSDGLKLRMRDLRREDQQRLKAFLERCSAGSIRARFFGTIKEFSNALMDQLVEVDGQKRMALVVTRGEADNEEIVAEARAVALRERPRVGDVALLVGDELQRRGIATRLFTELSLPACHNGFTHFCADVLADNQAMLAMIRKMGRKVSSTISYGVIHAVPRRRPPE